MDRLDAHKLFDSMSEEEKSAWLAAFASGFAEVEEYLACAVRFVKLFRKAEPEVLQEFYGNIEEIFDVYLIKHGLAPIADAETAENVMDKLSAGPCRESKRQANSTMWDRL